jgi:VanZ family protein
VIYLDGSRRSSKGKAVVVAILIGMVTSMIIEILQVYLPSRDSSLLDVITNTLGSGIGVGLGRAVSPLLQRTGPAA